MSDGSFGSIFRITSPAGAMPCSSCLATAANAFSPPSCQAISPQGVFLRGSPGSPRPSMTSNSVPTKTATFALGTVLTWAAVEDGIDPPPGAGVVSPAGEVVEGRERVRLPAAELGGHVEDGRGLDLDAREPPDDLGGEVEEALGHVGPLEEPLGLQVVGMGPVVADVVEVDGELRGVHRAVLAEVFPGRDDLIPGLELGHRLRLLVALTVALSSCRGGL